MISGVQEENGSGQKRLLEGPCSIQSESRVKGTHITSCLPNKTSISYVCRGVIVKSNNISLTETLAKTSYFSLKPYSKSSYRYRVISYSFIDRKDDDCLTLGVGVSESQMRNTKTLRHPIDVPFT